MPADELCQCRPCQKLRVDARVRREQEESGRIQLSTPDPWAHRSVKMSCACCMWFVLKRTTQGVQHDAVGRCRRHAPTMGGYPVVYSIDWCGDHKLDENKA